MSILSLFRALTSNSLPPRKNRVVNSDTEEGGDAFVSSPSGRLSCGTEGNTLPVLLQRAVKRVEEMENGAEAVSALLPGMGPVRDGMPVAKGGIQRVLHGLGERLPPSLPTFEL